MLDKLQQKIEALLPECYLCNVEWMDEKLNVVRVKVETIAYHSRVVYTYCFSPRPNTRIPLDTFAEDIAKIMTIGLCREQISNRRIKGKHKREKEKKKT